MPFDIDILENKVLGREYKRGFQEGKQEGELKGELKGETKALRRLIEKRFGALPPWAEERLVGRSAAELEELIVRVLDVKSVEELLN